MRDHHFGMLSRRHFLVWKERHLTKFDLGPWRPGGLRAVHLTFPLPFSTRMQTDGASFHLPANESLAGATDKDLSSKNQQHSTPVVVPRPTIDNVRWLCLAGRAPEPSEPE